MTMPLEDDCTDVGQVLLDYERDQSSRKLFKPKNPGDYYFRVLPPVVPPGQKAPYYRMFGRHYDFQRLVQNTSAPYSAICRAKTFNQDCFACMINERIQTVLPNGQVHEELEKFKFATKAKERFLLNILEVTPNNQLKGNEPQLWEVPKNIRDQIQSIFAMWHQKGKLITSPSDGFVLKVSYTASGRWVKADNVQPTLTSGPLPLPSWREGRIDFAKCLEMESLTNEQMKALYQSSGGGAAGNPAGESHGAPRSLAIEEVPGDVAGEDFAAATDTTLPPAGGVNTADPQVQAILAALLKNGGEAAVSKLLVQPK
jgi:hypothetical protein